MKVTTKERNSQEGGLFSHFLGPLMRVGLRLIKNVLKPFAKSVLILSGLTAAALATDAVMQMKIYASDMAKLIILNEEIKDIMEIVKHLEESGLLNKSVNKTIENKSKGQKSRFFGILLGILGASLLGIMLAVKGLI